MTFVLALCVLAVNALLVSARKSLWPRADPGQPPLQTLTIPLTLTDDRKYLVGINMSPGPNVQGFHFAVTTGTGYSMVVGDSCDSCDVSVQGYNQSKSTTAQSLDSSQEISLAGASASGNVIQEDCSLNTTVPTAPWVYPAQPIIVANQSDSLFTPGMSGVFGLGTNGLENDFNSTVIAGWLKRNPTRSNFSYGMMINGPEASSKSDGGVLHWIAPDVNAYDNANVVWKDMAPMNATSANVTGLTYDYYVTMDSWTVTVGSTTLTKMNLVTVLDPLLTSAIFPQEEATLIYATVPGAASQANTTSVAAASSSAISNAWSVPCDAAMQVAFTFGNLTFVLDEKSLVRRGSSGQCFGTIEEWKEQSVSEHLLGSTLIAKMYLIFQVSGAASGVVGFANRKSSTSSSGLSTGAIVGIAIGSAAFVGVVVGVIAFLLYRRRKKRVEEQHERDMSTVKEMPGLTPYLLGTEEQYSPGMTATSETRTAPSPYQPARVSPYNHAIPVSETSATGTADPDTPPPYLSNREEGGTGTNVLVGGHHQYAPVMIGRPPEDRKRRRDLS